MIKIFQKRGIGILQDIPKNDFFSTHDHVVLSEFTEVKVTLKTNCVSSSTCEWEPPWSLIPSCPSFHHLFVEKSYLDTWLYLCPLNALISDRSTNNNSSIQHVQAASPATGGTAGTAEAPTFYEQALPLTVTPVTVTHYSYSDSFWSQKESSYTKNRRIELRTGYSDTFSRPSTVTVSGRACIK